MTIAIQPNQSARVRKLKADHPYLEPRDIAEMTGADLGLVKAALKRPERPFKPKSRRPFKAGGRVMAGPPASLGSSRPNKNPAG